MIRIGFENEMSALQTDIIKMGSLIEEAIEKAIQSFKNHDIDKSREIINNDDHIDEFEKKIETRCLRIITKEQPIAVDLRKITTALKMVTDIERIGDHASDIAELVLNMPDSNVYTFSENITDMANTVLSMVHDSISAFVNTDLDLAKRTIDRDDIVDSLFSLVKFDLAVHFREEGSTDAAIDFLMFAKYLERIADHSVNICEWIEFSVTGNHKHIKII